MTPRSSSSRSRSARSAQAPPGDVPEDGDRVRVAAAGVGHRDDLPLGPHPRAVLAPARQFDPHRLGPPDGLPDGREAVGPVGQDARAEADGLVARVPGQALEGRVRVHDVDPGAVPGRRDRDPVVTRREGGLEQPRRGPVRRGLGPLRGPGRRAPPEEDGRHPGQGRGGEGCDRPAAERRRECVPGPGQRERAEQDHDRAVRYEPTAPPRRHRRCGREGGESQEDVGDGGRGRERVVEHRGW